jgi:tetratricopeptide (TPR) repeat protein
VCLRVRIVFTALFLALFAQAQTQPDPVRLIEKSAQLQRQGRMSEAVSLMRQLIATPGIPTAFVGVALNELGLALQSQSEYEAAEKSYKRALTVLESAEGAPPIYLLRAHLNLASMYAETGRAELAENERLQVPTGLLTEASDICQALNLKASIAVVRGDIERARIAYEEALAYLRRDGGEGTETQIASTLNNLGTLAFARKQWEEAVVWLDQAQKAHRSIRPGLHPDLAKILGNLAVAQMNMGSHRQALATLAEARQIAVESLGDTHIVTAGIMYTYSEALKRSGDGKLSKAAKKEADLIMSQLPKSAPAGMTVDISSFQSFRPKSSSAAADRSENAKTQRQR